MGMAWNDVTVNIKGGATCNNSKQLRQASSPVLKLIHIVASKAMDLAMDLVLNAPEFLPFLYEEDIGYN